MVQINRLNRGKRKLSTDSFSRFSKKQLVDSENSGPIEFMCLKESSMRLACATTEKSTSIMKEETRFHINFPHRPINYLLLS